MVRGNAREARARLLRIPFYRMHLRANGRSRQHQLLLDLESQGNRVYYVAPAFNRESEFNSAYRHRNVNVSSVFVAPSAIGAMPDNFEHYVSFQNSASRRGYLFSEPGRQPQIQEWLTVVQDIKTAFEEHHAPLGDELQRTEMKMIEILKRRRTADVDWEAMQGDRKEEDQARRIASLSQIFFDCILYIIQAVGLQSSQG